MARFKSTRLESFRSGPNQTVVFSEGQKKEKQAQSQRVPSPGEAAATAQTARVQQGSQPTPAGRLLSGAWLASASAMVALGTFSSTSLS